MILAAGYGRRLRPLTDHLPKPLVPVLGRPLIDRVIGNLHAAGVRTIGVNTHHLPEQLEQHLRALSTGCTMTLFREPEILGTGGGLANARDFLRGEDCFLLHNGDVLTDLHLAQLIAAHRTGDAIATIALTGWEPANTVLLGSGDTVRDIGDRLGVNPTVRDRYLTYTGVAVLSRDILDHITQTGYSSLIDALLDAIRGRPGAVRGYVQPGLYWNDLGTVDRLLDAHRHLLLDRRPALSDLPAGAGPVFRADDVVVAADVELEGFVSLGSGARIEGGVTLADCVVLDGVVVPAGASHRQAVLGHGWVVTAGESVPVDDAVGVGEDAAVDDAVGAGDAAVGAGDAAVGAGDAAAGRRWTGAESEPLQHELLTFARDADFGSRTRFSSITGHGSDRTFWHLDDGARRAVLMRTGHEDAEFERYIAIAKFLHAENLGGPEIFAVDHARRMVLMEDLGDDSLYHRMRSGSTLAPVDEETPDRIYRDVVDLLVDLQLRGTAAHERCPHAGDRLFDYDTLRWETDYFRQRFLRELVGVSSAVLESLDEEFHRLAEAVLTQPVVLIHRDFQSQNIMLMDGRIRLVDFQGMRRGPIAYDPLSLLRDSYVDIGPERRDILEGYYLERLSQSGGPAWKPGAWRAMATTAGLQRNMQALGAFAFLSREKGKTPFRRHIPLALRHLAEGLSELRAGRFPPGPLERLEQAIADLL